MNREVDSNGLKTGLNEVDQTAIGNEPTNETVHSKGQVDSLNADRVTPTDHIIMFILINDLI